MYPGVLVFIMNLPLCYKHSAIFTCVDRLTRYCRLIPSFIGEGALSASLVAKFCFDNVVRFFGIPGEMISYRYPRFTAFFC